MSTRAKSLLLFALLSALSYLLLHPPFHPADAAGRTALLVTQQFPSEAGMVTVEPAAHGLQHPWSLAFLPDGRMLVTERPGRLRVVSTKGEIGPAISGLPEILAKGQGGLLDVILATDYAESGVIFFSYGEPRHGGNGTAVARARLLLKGDSGALDQLQVIFRQQPTIESGVHFGSRLVLARDGTLFVTLGDRGSQREPAPRSDNHLGKIVRIHTDGRVPADNPYLQVAGARPELWSVGHRNVQGAALHPVTGALWTTEHGAQGGDELNAPMAGRDYGWPIITYGIDYSGKKIGEGITEKAGLEQPLWHWTPSIAPSGLAFYNSDRFPAWRGNLFAGSLKFGLLVRLTLDGEKVLHEERLLTGLGQRIRDVRSGPDGALYLLTDAFDGSILRVTLAAKPVS